MEGLPPAKPVSSRVRKGFQALAANTKKMKAIKENAVTSRFFDGSAPKTRERRQRARAQFELFVECCLGLTKTEDVWNKKTFISFTKQFLEGVANVSIGRFEEKIQTATLWSYKHALYWWAAVLVEDFHVMWQKWHEDVSRHIHKLGVQESLSARHFKKNNLSDGELVLIFRYIHEQRHGVPNLKQHWAAILLTWLTAARPGSFTVGGGYQQGATLGVPGKFRASDETLRWSDVQFVRMDGSIAVQITFKYNKGYRNPNIDGSRAADGERTFLFLPSVAERLEFDMTLILFGIAYERGLFVESVEDILDGKSDDVYIQKVALVDTQAVFVAADQSGRIDTKRPMNLAALNPKLQQLCKAIGLIERNTYYSLRRSAIIEVRRRHGKEKAQDLAFHVPSGNSLFFYDNVGFGDIDMHQFRLGGNESMTREEVQKFFSQANLGRVQVRDDGRTLTQSIDQQVKDRLIQDQGYIAGEKELNALFEKLGSDFEDLKPSGRVPEWVNVPSPFAPRAASILSSLFVEYRLDDLKAVLDNKLADRKRMHKNLRLRLRKEIGEQIRKEHRAILAQNVKEASRKLTPGNMREPKQVQNVNVSGIDPVDEQYILDAEDIAPPDEDDDEVDEEALQDSKEGHSREEPECWKGLENVVQVQIGSGKPTDGTEQVRRAFLMSWINQTNLVVEQSNLLCPRCQIDPTADAAAKNRRFNLFRLNTHMRGKTHTREEQLRRALKMDGKDNKTIITCPMCKTREKGPRWFIRHLKDEHPEQLWEIETDEGTEFEGFSDDDAPGPSQAPEHQSIGQLEEDVTDFEGFSSPVPAPAYVGKGKGKA